MKRIKKVKQTNTILPNECDIKNEYSDSTKDVYTCDYINKNSGGEEIYSTEETKIGTWLGKPLYRKVVEGTGASATGTWKTIGYIPNIEKWTNLHGYMRENNSGYTYIPQGQPNFSIWFAYNTSTGAINEAHNNTGFNNQEIKLVIEYTKTTD